MDLSDIRKDIDQVDDEIRRLFIRRMALSGQVAAVKAETADDIYKPGREQAIIEKNTKNMDPGLVREYTSLIRKIMELSRKYQYGLTLKHRDCFPFRYGQTAVEINKPAVLKQECHLFGSRFTSGAVLSDSYGDMADHIRRGKADAGMGVMESTGGGFCHELVLMLAAEQLFVNDCVIHEEDHMRRTLVTFTNRLCILPEHDRLMLLFAYSDCGDSLGRILPVFSDYGVSLTKLHVSSGKHDGPLKNLVFLEAAANMNQPDIRALIYQLYCESDWFRIIGSYRCRGISPEEEEM
ncbi:MAG: chorismate mutase [Eubacterium sp.]|nr:chorismate mutase [Eubacterium sp.]